MGWSGGGGWGLCDILGGAVRPRCAMVSAALKHNCMLDIRTHSQSPPSGFGFGGNIQAQALSVRSTYCCDSGIRIVCMCVCVCANTKEPRYQLAQTHCRALPNRINAIESKTNVLRWWKYPIAGKRITNKTPMNSAQAYMMYMHI